MNVWRTFENFSGFDLHLRSIINVFSLVLGQRLWDKFNPFLNLALQLCLQCKSIYQAVWQTYFLNPCYYGLKILQYFWLYFRAWWSFPPWHVIILQIFFFLLNLIRPPLKFIKLINSFWIMFKGSAAAWFLLRLIHIFVSNRASKVFFFSG